VRGIPATNVEEYLRQVPEEARPVWDRLRATLLSLVPDPGERFSYGIPVIEYRGKPLVGYGATATHCALYLMSTDVMAALASPLEAYDLGKGTIRFSPGAPPPEGLVREIVVARIAEVDAALTKRGRDA
jgi:uncharacterized protein YdhG (YjbR/CyaY superfamily)